MKKSPNDDTVLESVNTPNDDTVSETVDMPNAAAADGFSASDTPATEVKAAAAASSRSAGMSALTKSLIVLLVILGLGAGLVFWKTKFGSHGDEALTRITKEDMAILLKDANPMQIKQIAGSPEAKKKIAENLKQLLAVASQARKEGIANEPNVKLELENIRTVLTATIYDQKINGDKGPMPPFGYITEEQVNTFLSDANHEAEFKEFLDSKLALAKESGKFPKDKELTEDEIKQAKNDYAKIRIYEAEAKAKSGELGEEFKRELELQIKLQQAQFLAGQYAQKNLVEKVKVTDEDVQKYIAEHPGLDPKEKRATADGILKRALEGEDFAKLANEFSQDPGNKSPDGEPQGGIYKDVTKGKMMPAFEEAALALAPGEVADRLVETPYGYHIVKLERKGEGTGADGKPAETYDVRHILITTTTKDPTNPMAREMPVAEMVRQTLETEKQKKVLDEIVANNPIEVAEDFEIPEVSDEQMQQMMQQQMQMQQGAMPPPGAMPEAGDEQAPAAAPKGEAPAKPAPKK
ncbi:MAG TPA: peptidylprolyl isomerase [Pyrinomonadaceae bacterium]|nr:peptidylprolyl isomerase [Pyrinomonadaceae bacterium]